MIVDWGYVAIIGVFFCASLAYRKQDGSDPWTAAMVISFLILFGKAFAWLIAHKG